MYTLFEAWKCNQQLRSGSPTWLACSLGGKSTRTTHAASVGPCIWSALRWTKSTPNVGAAKCHRDRILATSQVLLSCGDWQRVLNLRAAVGMRTKIASQLSRWPPMLSACIITTESWNLLHRIIVSWDCCYFIRGKAPRRSQRSVRQRLTASWLMDYTALDTNTSHFKSSQGNCISVTRRKEENFPHTGTGHEPCPSKCRIAWHRRGEAMKLMAQVRVSRCYR
jgi:hypothetical protein